VLALLGAAPPKPGAAINMLRAALEPGPVREALVNRDDVCGEIWRRVQGEAAHLPALRVEHLFPADEATRRVMAAAG
jgi:hypothetical protein